MPLYFFYTMVQKSQKWPKTQIKGVLPYTYPNQGGGEGGTLCLYIVTVHFFKYLKNASSYELETFWQH